MFSGGDTMRYCNNISPPPIKSVISDATETAVVLESSALKPVVDLKPKPVQKKRKRPQIKSKPKKRAKKLRNEEPSRPSPLLIFGFKKKF